MKGWKAQKFFGDLVYDLRSRNLMPLVALLGVAIVVGPVMILRSVQDAPPPAAVTVDPNELAPDTQASVVAYKAPGLRSYRKRLRELRFKDPFKQQYVPKPGGADTLGDALATTIDTLGGTTTTTGDGGGGGGKTTTKTVVKVKEVSFQLSVAVGEVGALEPRHNVPLLSFLPGEQKPVVIFLGIADDAGTKALFLVSRDVAVVSGEGICASGLPPGCEILVMKAGQIEDFEYTPDGKIYALKVTGIKRVVTTS